MSLRTTIVAAACALLVAAATDADAQGTTGVIRGEVMDTSGGRLPDVTVIATTADGRVPATTTTTDATGGYVFRAMPPGPVMLRFRRDGFAGVLVGVTVEAGGESRLVQRLELAPLAETVVVEAPAPAPPPSPTQPWNHSEPFVRRAMSRKADSTPSAVRSRSTAARSMAWKPARTWSSVAAFASNGSRAPRRWASTPPDWCRSCRRLNVRQSPS
jgi:hypothetical protein